MIWYNVRSEAMRERRTASLWAWPRWQGARYLDNCNVWTGRIRDNYGVALRELTLLFERRDLGSRRARRASINCLPIIPGNSYNLSTTRHQSFNWANRGCISSSSSSLTTADSRTSWRRNSKDRRERLCRYLLRISGLPKRKCSMGRTWERYCTRRRETNQTTLKR
jgi:hypothetical protein